MMPDKSQNDVSESPDAKTPPGTTLRQGAEGDRLKEDVAYPAEMILEATERIFGHPRWVVDGALAYAKLTENVHLKKSEVQQAIDDFLGQQDQGHVKALAAQEEK